MRWGILALAIIIILLGAYWRFHQIDEQSLWHDEGNSLRLAERSVGDLIEATSRDIHPPGYYLLLKGWIGLVGTSELGLRSLSAFWGIIAIGATYGLGRWLFNWQAASLAALLVAANPFAIYYGQETRMYAQLGALSILSLYVFCRFLGSFGRNQPTQKEKFNSPIFWAIWLSLVNMLGLYTQYTYPFTMIVQGVWFVWWWMDKSLQNHEKPNQKGLQLYIGLNLVTLVLVLGWLPTAYDQITTWPTTGDMTPAIDRLDRIFMILVYGQTIASLTFFEYLLPIVLLVAVLLPIQLRNPQKLSSIWRIGLPLALVVMSAGALLFSGAYREANLKFLLPAQSAMAILIGRGATNIAELRFSRKLEKHRLFIHLKWGLTTVALFLAGLLSVTVIKQIDTLYTDVAFARSNYRGITDEIEGVAYSEAAIILNAPNQAEVFTYYYEGEAPIFPLPKGLGGDDGATRQSTMEIIEDYQRIYLVLWGQGERDPNNIVQTTLDDQAFVVGREWYNDVELVQYAVLDAPPSEPEQTSEMRFGENIVLEGYTLSRINFQVGAGDVLGVTLYWHTDAGLDTRYKVSVQLLDEFGRLADNIQHDSEPANGRLITTDWEPNQRVVDNHGLVLSQNLVAGEYQLIVVVYDPNLAENSRLQPANDDPNGVFRLGTIRLE